MFSDLLQYKRESFWEQHRIIRFDTLTAQAEYTVMAVFQGEAEDLFAYYQCTDAETPQEFAAYVDACKNATLYETGVTAVYMHINRSRLNRHCDIPCRCQKKVSGADVPRMVEQRNE